MTAPPALRGRRLACVPKNVQGADHARQTGRPRGGSIRIESRGDRPHQQAARRSELDAAVAQMDQAIACQGVQPLQFGGEMLLKANAVRSEEHTSELQSLRHLVCRLLLE